MKIGLKLIPGGRLPTKGTESSTGNDCYSRKTFDIAPMETVQMPLGVRLSGRGFCGPDVMFLLKNRDYGWGMMPPIDIQLRARSGLSLRGILVHLGTIDVDYRGEICAIVTNLSGEKVTLKTNDRVAQLVGAEFIHDPWNESDETERGENGFGSTGE